ncbi:MAG TPA: 2-oxo acid dehydrogenase subunit E2 [Ignavibacteria bacterium]|nr:2-oxo acid dehydrogenase subunit E2 [Ignavibacteria bacterium]HMR40097.1 2-oxo acid dehydrogenase subunit E2 [Ignavibacteria bacterium]
MIKEIKLPEVSDNVETGDVIKVLVKVGDKISIDQPIIELETEKASFEVPSPESGTVKEINVKQGDIIKIGAVILKIETNGSDKSRNAENKTKIEKVTESESESESGKDDRKSTVLLTSENVEFKKKEPEDIKTKDKSEVPDNISVELSSSPASPSVRRLARELGVEINNVTGTGEAGRISDEDVKRFVKEKINSSQGGSSVSQRSLPDFTKWGETEIQQMTKVRVITAESMNYAWSSVPMVTQFDKADITSLEVFRKKNIKKVESAGGNLTITSILVKVCDEALRKFPQFNTSIDLQKKEIVFKKYYNIGVAVDTDRGLLVPVIKNTGSKSITEISAELNELAEKARSKKITPDDMDGGNFTISNLGGIGGTGFTPIVYSPQVAILGVSRGNIEPIYINEEFQARMMLPLTLTYDHRIIDGADAARFLRWICEALENPMSMML